MSQTYSYDVATETQNGDVNPDVLAEQLLDAGLVSGGNFEGIEVVGGDYATGNVITGGTLFVTWQSTLSGPDETAQDGVVAAHAGPSFSSDIQSVENNTVSSTGVDSPQIKLQLDAVELAAGEHSIRSYCEVRLQNAIVGSGVRAAIAVDGTEHAEDNWDAVEWHAFSAEIPLTFEAGATPSLTVTFERTGAANTVEIRRARLEIELMPMP